MKTFAKFGAVAAVSALAAGVALAQDVAPAADQAAAQAAVEARQAALEAMGAIMDTELAPIMRRQAEFDAAFIAVKADEIAVHAAELPALFAVDTSGFGGIETDARNNIWQSHDAFLDKQAALMTALETLKTAAEGGEQAPTMRAVAGVGQACGSCHDDYKND